MRFRGRAARRVFGRRSPAGRTWIQAWFIGAGSVAVLSATSGYVLTAATQPAPAAASPSAAVTRAVLDE